jgi:hypothetical protein
MRVKSNFIYAFPDHETSTINGINNCFREMISNKILLYRPIFFIKGIKSIVNEGIHKLLRLRRIRFFSFLNYIHVFTEMA